MLDPAPLPHTGLKQKTPHCLWLLDKHKQHHNCSAYPAHHQLCFWQLQGEDLTGHWGRCSPWICPSLQWGTPAEQPQRHRYPFLHCNHGWALPADFPGSFTAVRGDTNALLKTHWRDPHLHPHPKELERSKPGTSSSQYNTDTDSKVTSGHVQHSYMYSVATTGHTKRGYTATNKCHSPKGELDNSADTGWPLSMNFLGSK